MWRHAEWFQYIQILCFLTVCKWKLLVGIWKTFLPWWKLVFQMGNHKVLYINLHVYFEFFAYFFSCFMVMVSLASNQSVLKFQKLERMLITLILFLFYLTFSSIISFFFRWNFNISYHGIKIGLWWEAKLYKIQGSV